MKKQIQSAFDEIKAEQQLKTDTKYFLYEFYNKKKNAQHKSRGRFILAPLSAVLVVVLSLGIFSTAVPVSAVSFDVDNTSVELELNSLNKVVKVNCFGEENAFSEIRLKNLTCEEAVSLIVEKAKNKNTDISSATLTVNCKNSEKAKKIAGLLSDKTTQDISISCHSAHANLRDEAHAYGISTGKYQAYLILKEYEADLSIEEAKNTPMSELNRRINEYVHGEDADPTTRPSEHVQGASNGNCHVTSATANGKHHGKRQ